MPLVEQIFQTPVQKGDRLAIDAQYTGLLGNGGVSSLVTIKSIFKTHLILPQCDVTRRQMNEALVFDYIKEEGAHAHAQNAPLEWFSATPGLGVMQRLLSKIWWLCIR